MTPDMSIFRKLSNISLGENCPYLEFFWSAFSRIRIEYGEILDKVRTRKTLNTATFYAERKNEELKNKNWCL